MSKVKLTIYKVCGFENKKAFWNIFKPYHYLSSELNSSATVFVAYLQNVLVGFVSYITMPSGTIRDYCCGHREVVLPDYQGMGIGGALRMFESEYLLRRGYKFYCKTSNYKLIDYYKNNKSCKVLSINQGKYRKELDKYRNTLKNGEDPHTTKKPFKVYEGNNLSRWYNRKTISVRYMGNDYATKKHRLVVFESKCSYNKCEKILNKITSDKYYWEVYCDDALSNGNCIKVCHNYGICSYSLFSNRFGCLIKDNFNFKDYDKTYYVYDDYNKTLLKTMKDKNIKCIKLHNYNKPLFG